ncbi:MAG: hypothetical protein KAR47_14300, partial [Planctomycetes bacterium]|nr:hypothetical protein [Planctomycetota bacterium]
MKHSKLILLICVVVAAVILWQVCFRDVWPFIGQGGESVSAAQDDPAGEPDTDQGPASAEASENGPESSGYDGAPGKTDKAYTDNAYTDYGDKPGEDKFDDSEMRDVMQSLGLGDGLFDSGGYYWSG